MAYPPPYYTDDDPDYARRLIDVHGFALLIVDGLDATHLPLLLRERDGAPVLLGHLSRQNPICEALNGPALAVFSGPHAYVSPNLYADPSRSVPTWNYASVQVRGRLSALPDDAVIAHLDDLARAYEGDQGWRVDQAEPYVDALKKGIIAIELMVESVQAFRKMSGNKPPAIQKRIIDVARAEGEHAFADEMTLALQQTQALETKDE